MTKKFNRGFTLIELLVVIAIIGILSSVVLASLNTARAKGADAAIKSSLNNARAQAELYYDGNGQKYGVTASGVCSATAATDGTKSIKTMLDGAGTAGSLAVACFSSDTAWAASAQLKTNTATYYCVDSTGKTGTAAATTTVCP
jgi:prepilin-type N-terminal cleavage/methylation domain-containing protein